MQLLGALLNHFARERGEKIVVLGATSGDTGAAAIFLHAQDMKMLKFIYSTQMAK